MNTVIQGIRNYYLNRASDSIEVNGKSLGGFG